MKALQRAGAALVIALFLAQGASTAARRLLPPQHFHVSETTPAPSPAHHGSEPENAALELLEAREPHQRAPRARSSSDGVDDGGHHVAGEHTHGHSHDRPRAPETGAHAAGDPRTLSRPVDAPLGSVSRESVVSALADVSRPRRNDEHRHAGRDDHAHAPAQPGVVYVDSGTDTPTPARAATAGFEACWWIVPTGVQLVLENLRAAAPRRALLATASRTEGPPDRPPRV